MGAFVDSIGGLHLLQILPRHPYLPKLPPPRFFAPLLFVHYPYIQGDLCRVPYHAHTMYGPLMLGPASAARLPITTRWNA